MAMPNNQKSELLLNLFAYLRFLEEPEFCSITGRRTHIKIAIANIIAVGLFPCSNNELISIGILFVTG
jgi:hypothetical protein